MPAPSVATPGSIALAARDTATVICLNVPTGCVFGIGALAWRAGGSFRGLRQVPPGAHFIHCTQTSQSVEASVSSSSVPRSGFWAYLYPGSVLLRVWDPETASLQPPRDSVDAERVAQVLHTGSDLKLLEGLACFPPASLRAWAASWGWVSPVVLERVCGPQTCTIASTDSQHLPAPPSTVRRETRFDRAQRALLEVITPSQSSSSVSFSADGEGEASSRLCFTPIPMPTASSSASAATTRAHHDGSERMSALLQTGAKTYLSSCSHGGKQPSCKLPWLQAHWRPPGSAGSDKTEAESVAVLLEKQLSESADDLPDGADKHGMALFLGNLSVHLGRVLETVRAASATGDYDDSSKYDGSGSGDEGCEAGDSQGWLRLLQSAAAALSPSSNSSSSRSISWACAWLLGEVQLSLGAVVAAESYTGWHQWTAALEALCSAESIVAASAASTLPATERAAAPKVVEDEYAAFARLLISNDSNAASSPHITATHPASSASSTAPPSSSLGDQVTGCFPDPLRVQARVVCGLALPVLLVSGLEALPRDWFRDALVTAAAPTVAGDAAAAPTGGATSLSGGSDGGFMLEALQSLGAVVATAATAIPVESNASSDFAEGWRDLVLFVSERFGVDISTPDSLPLFPIAAPTSSSVPGNDGVEDDETSPSNDIPSLEEVDAPDLIDPRVRLPRRPLASVTDMGAQDVAQGRQQQQQQEAETVASVLAQQKARQLNRARAKTSGQRRVPAGEGALGQRLRQEAAKGARTEQLVRRFDE